MRFSSNRKKELEDKAEGGHRDKGSDIGILKAYQVYEKIKQKTIV